MSVPNTIPKFDTGLLEPNATLYVSNIDWKIKKTVLRRALYTLFSRHGKILEIVTLRRDGLRGQAWIIFEQVRAATAALRNENGFTFFGKNLKVDYALEKSDRVAKLDGSYVPKNRKSLLSDPKNNKDKKKSSSIYDIMKTEPYSHPDTRDFDENSDLCHQHTASFTNNGIISDTMPSNIIFAQSLPKDCNEMMLAMLFRQYPGYREVRIPRPGLAFIEFDDEPLASVALKALNGFKLTANDSLKLKYGKA